VADRGAGVKDRLEQAFFGVLLADFGQVGADAAALVADDVALIVRPDNRSAFTYGYSAALPRPSRGTRLRARRALEVPRRGGRMTLI
jgi:hypothetical protein